MRGAGGRNGVIVRGGVEERERVEGGGLGEKWSCCERRKGGGRSVGGEMELL